MKRINLTNQILIDTFGRQAIQEILKEQILINSRKVEKLRAASYRFFECWYPLVYKRKSQDSFEKLMRRAFGQKMWSYLDKRIKLLNWQIRLYNACKRRKRKYPDIDRITDERVAMAKEVPIETLLDGEVNRAGFVLCPFHSEKTPSMKVYRDQNTYHCFGCQRGSDSIDLVMELHGLSFVEAVKFLA